MLLVSMYPLAEYCTPEPSALLGTILLFFILHLSVLVLLNTSLSLPPFPAVNNLSLPTPFHTPHSTDHCLHLRPPSGSQDLGWFIVPCQRNSCILSIIVILLWTFPRVWRCRDLTCTQYSEGSTLNSYGGTNSQSYPFRTISNAGFAYWLLWISRLVFCHHLHNFLLNANGWAHNPSLHVEISPPYIAAQ